MGEEAVLVAAVLLTSCVGLGKLLNLAGAGLSRTGGGRVYLGSRQASEAPCTSNVHDFIILRRSLQHPQRRKSVRGRDWGNDRQTSPGGEAPGQEGTQKVSRRGPALADHQGADPIPTAGKDPNKPQGDSPLFQDSETARRLQKALQGKIQISFPESCGAFASRIRQTRSAAG